MKTRLLTVARDLRARGELVNAIPHRVRGNHRTPRPEVAGYHSRGFTLIEMMITIAIMGLLAGMVFVLMTGILQSASTLQENQNRGDRMAALYNYVETKLTTMPARSTIASYARGDGEGLNQNGIVFGNTNLATAIDAKVQSNGLYLLRLATFATSSGGQDSQDARQTLLQAVETDQLPQTDPPTTWTTLLTDVKTLTWKFQDATLVQWDTAWTSSTTPNLVEFDLQGGGDRLPTTMDFWVPKINPITVHIQANGTPGGGSGGRGGAGGAAGGNGNGGNNPGGGNNPPTVHIPNGRTPAVSQ